MKRTVVVLLALSLATACTSRLDYLKRSPEFTHQAIENGSIALTPAGCMVSPEKVTTRDLAALRAGAVAILAKARPKMPVKTAQDTDLALGEEVWNPLMTYTKTSALPGQDLETLATRAGVRFLGLLRVETWDVERVTEEIEIHGEGGAKNRIAYRKRTWGTMQLRLTVYDNKDGSLAWLGIEEASLANDDIGPFVDPDNAEAVRVAQEAATKLPYPPAPSPVAVGEVILRKFVEHFPKAPKK
jgi:hypothetical protein